MLKQYNLQRCYEQKLSVKTVMIILAKSLCDIYIFFSKAFKDY